MEQVPRTAALATEFPIFPLPGAVVLPGGKLPLNIFEPRYLNMVEDALSEGRLIGMIQPDLARPPTPTGPGLYKIGCLGRITSFHEIDDGRYLITLAGLTRFAITTELEMRRGYRRVRADISRFKADREPDPGPVERDTLLAALRSYFQARGFDANWGAIDEMADPVLVATLSMVCPFRPPEKQALLEAPDTRERARALLALLHMGAHDGDSGSPSRQLS